MEFSLQILILQYHSDFLFKLMPPTVIKFKSLTAIIFNFSTKYFTRLAKLVSVMVKETRAL